MSDEPEFRLIEDPYTEKESRIHIARLYDYLSNVSTGETNFEHLTHTSDAIPLKNVDVQPRITYFAENDKHVSPVCLTSISLSAWNPVPPQYRCRGHLLYLQVVTLEGETIHITSSTSGYVLNNSTASKFDPSSRGQSSHSLLYLLRSASPSFKRNYAELQKQRQTKDLLLTVPLTNASTAQSWLLKSPDHKPDPWRVQKPYIEYAFENNDSLRDWNEELQSTRELPVQPLQERILRSRLLQKTLYDFSAAAAKGAELLVKGELTALNPTEDPEAQMFIFNNIFFSRGLDGVGTFHRDGGDAAAHKAVSLDVNGVQVLSALDVEGLSTLGTCIVDYAGERIVAQSIVPGIFRQRPENESQIIYGGVDGRDAIATDPKCDELFAKVARALRYRRHAVYEKVDDLRKELELSIETKGLAGADGRSYILDLYRLTPVDVQFLESECEAPNEEAFVSVEHVKGSATKKTTYPHRMVMFRQELMEAYWEVALNAFVKDKMVKEDAAKAEADGVDKIEANGEANGEPESERRVDISDFSLAFNPDTFNSRFPENITDEDKECRETDEMTVREVSKFLHDRIIPNFISALTEGSLATPLDSATLARLMHKRGINLRYLGELLNLAIKADTNKLTAFITVATRSILARSFKHVLMSLLRGQPHHTFFGIISDALNSFFGGKTLFRDLISQEAFRRFRYTLPDWTAEQELLREIALQCGLQLAVREYQDKFSPDDILNIVPRVKDSSPRSGLAEEAMEAGRLSIARGQLDLGKELLSEAHSLFEQIYGVLHPEAARGYNNLAMIYNTIEDKPTAVELAKKAVVVAERTLGVDSGETILMYLNLALFEHSNKNTKQGLAYIEHALKLWFLIFGQVHPDVITTMNNIAVMLQSLQAFAESLKWFEKSVETCTAIYGADSINVATLYFQVAQAMALTGDHKGAISRMRESHNIFKKELGEDDRNTKETWLWYTQLTSNAVNLAKQARLDAAKGGKRQTPLTVQNQLEKPDERIGVKGTQSIDELVKYISGDSNGTVTKKKKSKKARRPMQ